MAKGGGRGRIYTVEPTGPFDDDHNLTDKKFPATAHSTRCGSGAKWRAGSAIRPNGSKK